MKTTPPKPIQIKGYVTLQKGKPPMQQPYFGSGAWLYLTPEYLRGNSKPESVKPSENAIYVSDGDIVVLWDGSNAGEFLRARKGILASTMSLINSDGYFNNDYLYYALKFWDTFLRGQTIGSGIPHVDRKAFDSITILPFDTFEQSKIAEILSTVDRAIEQTEALIAKHQRIKAGLMQDLLTRGIDEEGNIRAEETHEFKNSPLGRIPVEWEIKRISEIGSIFTGTTPSTFNQTFWNGEIVWVTPHDLSKLTTPYLVNSAKKIAAKGLKSYSLNLLPAGSIIISSRAPIGYIAISKMSFCTNQGCKSIKLKEEFIPEFIYYNMAFNINWIKQLGEGTTFAEISKDALSAIKLAVPTSKYEQTEISNIIRTVDLGIEHRQNNYRKLRSLKTALMQDLLTGKVRVTPLLNETEVAGDERGSSHPADSA